MKHQSTSETSTKNDINTVLIKNKSFHIPSFFFYACAIRLPAWVSICLIACNNYVRVASFSATKCHDHDVRVDTNAKH